MLSSAPLFLALRYLRPKRSFVSIITLISILGVMLGVGVMVAVMAVFKGWQVEFKKLLLGFEPHVTLVQQQPYEGEVPEGFPPLQRSNWREVLKAMQQRPGVFSATPIAEGAIAIRLNGSDPEGAEVLGLRDDADNGLLNRLRQHVTEGGFKLKDDSIVITDRIAKKLNIKVGDVLSVLARDTISQMIRDLRAAEESGDAETAREARAEIVVLPQDLTVVGIVRADTAGERCYVPLHIGQDLFNLDGNVSGIEIELANPDADIAFVQSLFASEQLPPDWDARTWSHEHQEKLQNVENQQSLMWFLLLFIMLVAAVCVMNTTITVTVQKRREIGILTALGSRAHQIIGIFVTQAGVVAVFGVLSGMLCGQVFLHFRNDLRDLLSRLTGRDFFPQEIYFLSEIPAHVEASDLIYVSAAAAGLCLIAGVIPAWFAARVDPAVALRDVQ